MECTGQRRASRAPRNEHGEFIPEGFGLRVFGSSFPCHPLPLPPKHSMRLESMPTLTPSQAHPPTSGSGSRLSVHRTGPPPRPGFAGADHFHPQLDRSGGSGRRRSSSWIWGWKPERTSFPSILQSEMCPSGTSNTLSDAGPGPDFFLLLPHLQLVSKLRLFYASVSVTVYCIHHQHQIYIQFDQLLSPLESVRNQNGHLPGSSNGCPIDYPILRKQVSYSRAPGQEVLGSRWFERKPCKRPPGCQCHVFSPLKPL